MDGGDTSQQNAEVSGRVTNDAKTASTAKAAKANVSGATVTAVSVGQDGSTTELEGEATTESDGTFTLDLEGEGAQEIVIVKAEKESANFSSRTVVKVDGRSAVDAPPMTRETSAEAGVYVAAKEQDDADDSNDDSDDSDGDSDDSDGEVDGEDGVTVADVAVHVDAELAAEINAGSTSEADVATAITNSVNAEAAFLDESSSDVEMEAVEDEKEQAYLQLQSQLSGSANANARTQAIRAFEEAMARIHAEAGASAETQAKTRQAAASTALETASGLSAEARTELRQKVELLRGISTAVANEARFQAANATSAGLDSLANARARFVTQVRANANASATALNNAKALYKSEVEEDLTTGLDVTATTVNTARTSISGALSTLEGAISTSGESTAQAYVSFYTSAEASAASAFTTNATAAGKVVVLTEAM